MDKRALRNFFQRQTFVILSCLVVVILGTTLVSSAVFTATASSSSSQSTTSASFSVSYSFNNSAISDIYVSSDDEGMTSSTYSFTVTNSSSTMASSYAITLGKTSGASVSNGCVKYSIDGTGPRILSESPVYSGTTDTDKMYLIKTNNLTASSGGANSTTHSLRVWLSTSCTSAVNNSISLSVQVQSYSSDPTAVDANNNVIGQRFDYKGSEETFTVPYTGTYTITAAGAEGGVGNIYGKPSNTIRGGKGAVISADFALTKGNILHIIVGGKGYTTSGTATNGASGAGGGGAFVFKEISSITNSNYQFTKSSVKYDALLVAAGGGGTGDIGYGYGYAGYAGNGVNYKSPSNFTAYSTSTCSSSSYTSGVLGISQYISYGLTGSSYTYNSSKCTGVFGGGGCNYDVRSYGGGWSGSSYTTYSWSQGTNTVGQNGANYGDGYVTILFKN